jgi:hypothetical protein
VISTELCIANFAPARFPKVSNAKVPEDACIGGDSDEEDDVDSDSEKDEEGEECAQDDTDLCARQTAGAICVKDEQIALDWCW